MIRALLDRARSVVLPWWAKWAALATLVIVAYGMGRLQEARHGADAMVDYVGKQAAQTFVIVKREVQVVTQVETQYRDRVQKIYLQGAEIEKHITDYVQPADDARFAVNAGFLRNIDAAWSGSPVGPAEDSDREPAGVPLSEVAAVETGNATSCRIWRVQALGWRQFYAGQQAVINGKAGDWWPTASE